MSETDFVFSDDIPETGNPVSTSGLSCEVCGAPLSYGGRGRKPRFCDEHKPRRGSASSSTRGSSGIVARAITELEAVYGTAGLGLRYVDKISGEIVYNNRAELAESWRMLLDTNKKVRDLFAKIEGSAAWLPLITTHVNLIASIWIAHGIQDVEQAVNDVSS